MSNVDEAGATGRSQPLLFIGGLGRSGSTLVEKLLNELPATFSVGETVHLWERGVRDHERCGCGAPFAECPHWAAVGKAAFGGWDNVDVDRLIDLRWSVDRSRRLPQIFTALRTGRTSAAQREYLAALRAVLLASADVAAADRGTTPDDIVLLDSSKHLSTAALLACDPQLDVRVLHLVRDPRGVAYSWMKTVERPETDGEIMPQYSASRTAGRWVTDNLGFESLAKLGVPTMTIRYEDILAEPTKRILEIARFAGAAPAACGRSEDHGDSSRGTDHRDGEANEVLPFVAGQSARFMTPMHSVAGNPLRFGGDSVTLRLDDAWQSQLPLKSRRMVDRVTGPILARYGYSRSA